MDYERIANAIDDPDLTTEDVEAIANSIGLVYAETGAKRQHQEYEPDEIKTGMAASVPDGVSEDATSEVLREMCWAEVEEGHAERKETYARKDGE